MATKPVKKKTVEKKAVAKKVPAVKKAAAKPAKAATAKKAPAKVATSTPKVKKTETVTKVQQVVKPKNPNGSFTQSEFLENFRAYCGLEKRSQAKDLAVDIQKLVQDSLVKGYKIPFFGLGKLYVRVSAERMGRNPQTGETTKIPARKRVRFTPAKALKDVIGKK